MGKAGFLGSRMLDKKGGVSVGKLACQSQPHQPPKCSVASVSSYKPRKRIKEILEWTLQRINSGPYRVTARWIFYRLVQELGFSKCDYKNFLRWTSRARKSFYTEWAPNTLADDTRRTHERGFGYPNANAWIQSFRYKHCVLDKYLCQDYVVEIWFEAEAMYSQFNHYTSPYNVTLRPFKGDPSIDYKWNISKDLEALSNYEKPIAILYFGDYDEKGFKILESALKDIKAWCDAPFHVTRCGINQEHIREFGLIEQPERPGTYQWEALPEDAARKLILDNLEKFWSLDSIRKIEEAEARAEQQWIHIIDKALGNERQ